MCACCLFIPHFPWHSLYNCTVHNSFIGLPFVHIQVSALAWNRQSREIISSHGNPKNQLAVWKCSTMCKVGEITGHEGRILQMNLSPQKTSVATISADETLRVWKCFEQPAEQKAESSQSYREDSINALVRNVP